MAASKTLARLQDTIDRRCDANDFPKSTCRRKALRLYSILSRKYPGGALTDKYRHLYRSHRAAAAFFEPITAEDAENEVR